jgi:hypothetical protein
MKKTLGILLPLAILLISGCGSKSNPNDSTPAKSVRVVVGTAASAPSMSDPNSAVWSSVTPVSVKIMDTTPVKAASMTGINLVADSVLVQALKLHDTLYLRLRWHDATHDVWPSAWYVRDTLQHCYSGDTSNHCANFVPNDSSVYPEDRLVVLFGGLSGNRWDALDWHALTTGAGFLAEGAIWEIASVGGIPTDVLVPDTENAALLPAYPNGNEGFVPYYMHKDSSLYHGSVLYYPDENTVTFNVYSKGWAINQFLPGFYIDSSLVNKAVDVRGSRWDTRAIDVWDTTTSTYTLVLCHPMNTTYPDDVDLVPLDSVSSQIGVFNAEDGLVRSSKRGFTATYWLILK